MKKWSIWILVILLASVYMVIPTATKAADSNKELYNSIKKQIENRSEAKETPRHLDKRKLIPDLEKFQQKVNLQKQTSSDFKAMVQEVYEVEPNNYFNQANPLNVNDIVYGMFTWDDIDLYKIQIDSYQEAFIVFGAADYSIDLGYALINENQEFVEPYYYDVLDGIQVQVFDIQPGTYYIAAIDLYGGGSEGVYAIGTTVEELEPPTDQKDAYRINGQNRYETAIQISNDGWPEGADTVVLARDLTFPDALAGAPLAYQLDAPILLNPKDYLHKAVEAQIANLGANNIIILGGTGAISPQVENYLRKTLHLNVRRIGGKNRYETAANIALAMGNYDQAVVALGGNFPDALSIAPYAAVNGMPIILTDKNSIPKESGVALQNVQETIVVGGTGVISKTVENQLPNATRISGGNRYETSVNIVRQLGMPAEFLTIATGENFADALTGSVLAAKYYEPIVLVKTNELPLEVRQLIDDMGSFYFTILGGTNAVSDNVVNQLLQ